MNLILTKPLIVFDLETTGLDISKDKIIEMAMIKACPDGKTEEKIYRLNPGMKIPAESSKFHGIYDADVIDCPTFKEKAKEIAAYIGNADLGGFNSIKFDVPLLIEEFLNADVDFDLKNRRLVDAQNIFHKMERRNLKAAYKFYCGEELINAHNASADTRATFEVLKAQITRYENVEVIDDKGQKSIPIKNDIKVLSDFSIMQNFVDFAGRLVYNENNEECFNFGKHKGKRLVDLFKDEASYYSWMMNGDFSLYTKKILTAIKLREFKKN